MFWSWGSGICGECWPHIRLITTSRARTWRWRRMRRYDELSRGAERSSPRQFFPDCTIAMCGYDFREGHGSLFKADPKLAHVDMDQKRAQLSRHLTHLAQSGERDLWRLANRAIGGLRRER